MHRILDINKLRIWYIRIRMLIRIIISFNAGGGRPDGTWMLSNSPCRVSDVCISLFFETTRKMEVITFSFEPKWLQLNPLGSNSIKLIRIESNRIELNRVVSNWIKLNRIEFNRIGLNRSSAIQPLLRNLRAGVLKSTLLSEVWFHKLLKSDPWPNFAFRGSAFQPFARNNFAEVCKSRRLTEVFFHKF